MTLWLERLALLGALSALVLAIFWPHVGPTLLPFIQKVLINPISALLNRQMINIVDEQYSGKQKATKEHPKFSGGSLRRMASDKESIYSAYRSLEGFGQSSLSADPSLSIRRAAVPPTSGRGGHMNPRLSEIGGGGEQISLWLMIFTATMLVPIIYTLMRVLTPRFTCKKGNVQGKQHWRAPASCLSSSASHHARVYKETRDLRQDKRRFARLSREDRARELILHHGGRNVSTAIRFLVGELEKQKHLLFENLSSDPTCDCSCHTNDACELPSPSVREPLDKPLSTDEQRLEQVEKPFVNGQQQQQETSTKS